MNKKNGLKYKKGIPSAVLIAALLVAAWFLGGNYGNTQAPVANSTQTAEIIVEPSPMEPSHIGEPPAIDGSFTVTLSVRCDKLLDNMGLLGKEKRGLIPSDGVIFPAREAVAYEGESAFNILQREMKRAKIHLEFANTPIYGSAYIEGLNNLYEFDAGVLSGWMYAVNGWYPNYGCSRYKLKPGDIIKWNYTCDFGRDLGREWATGGHGD